MSVPKPASAIDGHCSAVYKDTLFVLSDDSFQSLPLKLNATWSTLKQGVAVSGPSCVAATNTNGGDASLDALYVLGGTTTGADESFSGVQRYLFATETWESLSPPTKDMQSRTNHSAVFLPGPASIVVFAGSQPSAPSLLSSQTFEIGTSPPYNIKSFTSQAPPGTYPLLMPWDQQSAVMVGGTSTNTEVWLFGSGLGWSKTQIQLPSPLSPNVRGSLVSTSDGAKVLETYDLTASPNIVSHLVLQGSNGKSISSAYTIGGSKPHNAKRDLSVASWPAYNSSNAPSVARSDYGVSQDSQGRTVFSGGNADVPINLYNQDSNAWIDNGMFFAGKASRNQTPLQTSATSSRPTTTPTATTSSAPSATTSAPPIIPGGSNKNHMLKILGITLGVLCGVAILFVAILLLLRRRKQKRRQKREVLDEKADAMSFRDRGTSYMNNGNADSLLNLSTIPPSHRFTEQDNNHNSFAMIAAKLGKGAKPRSPHRTSTESTRRLVPSRNEADGTLDMRDIRDDSLDSPYGAASKAAATNEEGKRSSGWSRYFESGTERTSKYPTSMALDNNDPTRPSLPPLVAGALVPPLDFTRGGEAGERFSQVATGSPSFNHSSEDLARQVGGSPRGRRAHLSNGSSTDGHRRTRSGGSDATFSTSVFSELSDHLKTGTGATETSAWGKNSREVRGRSSTVHTGSSSPRPPSSTYTASIYADRDSVRRATQTGGSRFFLSSRGDRDILRPTSRHNRGLSPSQDMSFPIPPNSSSGEVGAKAAASDRPVTEFPRGVPTAYHADRFDHDDGENAVSMLGKQPVKTLPTSTLDDHGGTSSDMSWFQLGNGNNTANRV